MEIILYTLIALIITLVLILCMYKMCSSNSCDSGCMRCDDRAFLKPYIIFMSIVIVVLFLLLTFIKLYGSMWLS